MNKINFLTRFEEFSFVLIYNFTPFSRFRAKFELVRGMECRGVNVNAN